MRRAARHLLGAIVLLLALGARGPAPTYAQTPEAPAVPLRVTISVEPEEPRLGELVHVVVQVEHPSDRVVVLTRGVERSATLEVIAAAPPVTAPQGNGQTTSFSFTVQPFALGGNDLGSVELQVLAEDGSSEDLVAAIPPFSVPSTLGPGAALRPLKPQATVAGAPPAWVQPAIYAAVGVLVVAVGSALVLQVRRRLAHRASTAPLPLPATAEDEARRQLDAIRARDLLTVPDLETFYGQLSSITRGYLEERFDFRATALTRRELERRMAAEGLDRWQTRLVAGLLERCDAAVYARVYPPLASADHDLTVAYEIVELARPPLSEAVPA
ncbi:MAG: hypothetical protein IT299_01790 [Dehalococcoidia bacterium]|nr:hypothetical protein [Dehalococcoidia bacterium]